MAGAHPEVPLQGDQPLQGLEDLAIAPPTKSVRPQEPAKRVSPQKSTSPTRKVREPGEWPGVWRTWMGVPPKSMVSPSFTVWMPSTGARSMYWSPAFFQLTSLSWT